MSPKKKRFRGLDKFAREKEAAFTNHPQNTGTGHCFLDTLGGRHTIKGKLEKKTVSNGGNQKTTLFLKDLGKVAERRPFSEKGGDNCFANKGASEGRPSYLLGFK